MPGQLSFVLALRELALEPSQRPVQSDDTANGQPAVKARRKADDGDERHDDGDDEEQDAVDQRGQPERRVPLPERGARAVEALRSRRERQIVGLLGGKLAEPIERPPAPSELRGSLPAADIAKPGAGPSAPAGYCRKRAG